MLNAVAVVGSSCDIHIINSNSNQLPTIIVVVHTTNTHYYYASKWSLFGVAAAFASRMPIEKKKEREKENGYSI